jgi:hypothetical protein
MQSTRSPLAVAFVAFAILALGFVAGLGYQSFQHAQQNSSNNSTGNTSTSAPRPPVIRNMRISNNDRLLAFTAITNNSKHAGRFVFDLQTYRWNEAKSPAGWQDSIAQWDASGSRILFERERIPRPTDSVTPGAHQEKIWIKDGQLQRSEPEALGDELEVANEKSVASFWTPNGKLVMKTRRESKALFWEQNGTTKLIDRSPGTYYQNRAVRENNQTVFYVVRDVSLQNGTVALLRVVNGKSRRIGEEFSDVVWAYLSENARWLVICRYAPNGRDWEWSLYQLSPDALRLVKKAIVPEDVIAVYWSPDYKQILGAAGKSLWLVNIPDLNVKKLGERDDWNADDAAWLSREKAVIVGAAGHLWKVNTVSGVRREVWKFPDEYWQ